MRRLLTQLLVLPLVMMNVLQVFSILQKEKPFIVVVNSLHGMIPFYILSMIFPKTLIIFIAHSIDVPLNRAVFKLMAKADKIVCVSSAIKERLEALGFSTCEVIPNGVEVNVTPKDFSLRSKFFPCEDNVFVFVGRLSEEKNLDSLIDAINLYNRNNQCKPVCLLIVGEGSQDKKLKDQVNQGELEEKIKFAGFVESPQKYLSSFEALFLVSHWEGMPLVLLEAFSQHLLVIGSPVVGIRELINDGFRGILTRGTSAKDLYEAIERFSSLSFEQKKLITNNGATAVIDNFSKQGQEKAFLNVLKPYLET